MGNKNKSYFDLMVNAYGGAGMLGSGIDFAALEVERKREEERLRAEAARKRESLLKHLGQFKDVVPSKLSKPAPDYVATLTGWRGWKVQNGKLVALGASGAWEPKKAKRAICRRDSIAFALSFGGQAHITHEAPTFDCNCGYWSFKSMDLLSCALTDYVDSVDVVGSVDIWGRVIECENGFRSEYAYPKEFWLLKPHMEFLSWTYDVPVRTL